MTFTIAIAGRPNVGKSTLFNRLAGRRLALVDDTPGVTRDRRMADASLGELRFRIVDTAGLEESSGESLSGRMRAQTRIAVEEADLCLFLFDSRAGITPADKSFANLLRRSGGTVILVANKFEGKSGEAGYYDSFSLGLGEPVPISAEHGLGMADLHDAIVAAIGKERAFPPDEKIEPAFGVESVPDTQPDLREDFLDDADLPPEEGEDSADPMRPVKIAIVGRPNSGKSTLINRMVGEDRLLTGPEAGITRDSIHVDWQWNGKPVRLYDTAGMRRRARVQEKLEKLSVADGLRAVQFAEVVVVLLDATQPFDKQDLHIADLVIREGRAPIIALNKWDKVEDRQKTLAEAIEKSQTSLAQIKGLRLVPLSGLMGEGIDDLMRAVFDVHAAWNRRISTARLNRWLAGATDRHPPPALSGRRIKIKYITQAKSRPPTFVASCTRPDALPESYSRYLINSIRETFDLWAVPVRLHLRRGENPYAGRRRKS